MRQQELEKKNLLEQLKLVPIIGAASRKVGVSRSTVYRWMQDDKIFAARMRSAMALGSRNLNDLAYGKLVMKIHQDDLSAIIFFLRNCHPLFKKPKMKIEINQKQNIAPEITNDMYNQIALGKLPKKLRKFIVRRGLKMQNALQEVVDKIPEYKGTIVPLKFETPGDVLKDILEENQIQRPL